jgi:hypothetical protein
VDHRSDLGAVNKEIFLVCAWSLPRFHWLLSRRFVNAYWALRAPSCMPSWNITLWKTVCPPLHMRHIPYIARYAAASQPTNEEILLIFYKCSFSKERSVLPEDGRVTETCRSWLIFKRGEHVPSNTTSFNYRHIHLRATCFDLYQSSSGPFNKIIKKYRSIFN